MSRAAVGLAANSENHNHPGSLLSSGVEAEPGAKAISPLEVDVSGSLREPKARSMAVQCGPYTPYRRRSGVGRSSVR